MVTWFVPTCTKVTVPNKCPSPPHPSEQWSLVMLRVIVSAPAGRALTAKRPTVSAVRSKGLLRLMVPLSIGEVFLPALHQASPEPMTAPKQPSHCMDGNSFMEKVLAVLFGSQPPTRP